ncbi:MAG: NADH-quinone oxidoreductase subunit L [Bacteroidetes bacterium]|jgi:NADH-quinone oxidoreductase subunit L|nr:MAG: NADH-quinone oxidoreductase subunit L [Bacteroidota bacterium]
MESSTALISFIIGLPLLGFLIHGIAGLSSKEYRTKHIFIGTLSTLFVFIPFLLLLSIFFQFTAESEPLYVSLFRWVDVGSLQIDAAYRIDQLSLVMSLVVTGVGSLIHLYSMGYMSHDKGYWKFFAYLNLFIFAMLNLVLSNNMLLMFLGWEGVGVCSYLLIGFWYTDMKKSDAAKKAFIYNRVGDFAFLVAMFMIFGTVGSLNFDQILDQLYLFSSDQIFWISLLMLIGATGKSAQFPLFLWLPDAMAGPTPVSALIHAATMVTSGIYLFARMSPMVILSPEAMMIVAVIGALTAIVAATIAITQTDIKGVLAYSTVSQLGFMFLALGSGAFTAAIFHVVTHAFFKACLFLGSGSVIHAMEHVKHKLHENGKHIEFDHQDIRYMGGLKNVMPSTYKTFLISTIAIAGIPPLAGFFSKDEILMHTINMGTSEFAGVLYFMLWFVASLTAFLTAFYMFRLTYSTFFSEFRLPTLFKDIPESESYLHESPKTMTLPLWVLASLAILGGLIGIPNFFAKTFGSYAELHLLEHWLDPVVSAIPLTLSVGFEWFLMIVAILIALAGVYLAKEMYDDGQMEFSDEEIELKFPALYPVWREKYRLDEFYHSVVIRPVVTFSEKVLAVFDLKVLDGIVNLTGGTVRFFGSLARYSQSGITGQYALFLILGVVIILSILLF